MKIKTLCLTTALCTVSAFSAQAERLIINSYGGPYKSIIKERIIKPFEKKFGIRVIYDATGGAAQDYAKIKATRGHPGWDVVIMTPSQSLLGCSEGILEKLSDKTVPNLAFLNKNVREIAGECGAIHEVQYMSLMWRTDKLSPPTSWNVLTDPSLKGKIVLPKFSSIMAINLTQVFSTMNNGTLDEPGPGFAAIASIAPNAMSFERSSAIMGKYVREGKIYALPFWSGRAQLLKDEGLAVDYTIPKEGTVPMFGTLNIPIAAPNKSAALKFVNFFLSKTSQEAWVTGYNVGSIRTDIEISDDIRAKQITTDKDIEGLLLPNFKLITEKNTEWGERWKREVISQAN